MKYIRYEGGGFTLIPDTIEHKDVKVGGMFTGKPINAGKIQIFVRDGELHVNTYGESTSLNLKADKDDGMAIKNMIENY